jgi:hypothetical protein
MASIISASTTSGTALNMSADTTGVLQLATGATPTTAVTIDTSQTVGINTLGRPAGVGGGDNGKLWVKQTTTGNYGIAAIASATDSFTAIATNGTTGVISTSYGLTGSYLPLAFHTSDVERMRIDSSGGLILAGSTAQKATGTTWSNPSDQRLKDNIRDYTKGTNELMQVRVREWEYNGKGGTTEGMNGLGVIADEVMTILPNTVETYDAKLNADDEKTTAIKKFDATEITWLLVKTVQEQQTIINDLKARIETLESK